MDNETLENYWYEGYDSFERHGYDAENPYEEESEEAAVLWEEGQDAAAIGDPREFYLEDSDEDDTDYSSYYNDEYEE